MSKVMTILLVFILGPIGLIARHKKLGSVLSAFFVFSLPIAAFSGNSELLAQSFILTVLLYPLSILIAIVKK